MSSTHTLIILVNSLTKTEKGIFIFIQIYKAEIKCIYHFLI